MISAAATKWIDTDIVFLLEITWGSYTYRFSTFPIAIGDYFFEGGLENPEINLSMSSGFNIDGDSIPFRLVFPVDVAYNMGIGNLIDGSTGELSYVLVKNGISQQTYDRRYVVFRGVVSEPIYGQIDQPTGYVEFSLEEKIYTKEVDLLQTIVGPNGRVDNTDISNEDKAGSSPLTAISTAGIVDVLDVHKGKPFPVVIGRTGFSYSLGTMTPRDNIVSPAYLIGIGLTGTLPAYFLIAGHLVEATTMKVYDSEGNSDTGAVDTWVNANNDIFSFCAINFNSTNLKNAKTDENIEYYCVWDLKGGYPSPYNEGVLEGGIDIILWCLEMVTTQIDYDSFFAAMPYLNKYKFSGYINEPINPVEFAQNNIIPFMPVDIQVGPKGIRPIIDLAISGDMLSPGEKITADSEFSRMAPLQTSKDLSGIVNQLEFNFAKNAIKNKYSGIIRIVPDQITAAWFEFSNDYAYSSLNLFGRRSIGLQADYVFDYNTAVQIAEDYIKKNSLPSRQIIYSASPKYGYIWIGDIIELTDTDINLNNAKCQVIAKRWTGSNWEYTLKLENKAIVGVNR